MGALPACVSRAITPLPGARRALSGQLHNRCSVAVDEWASSPVQRCMSTTLHYIDEDSQLQALPIA